MNKKIFIPVIIVFIIAISSFVGYSIYDNKMAEKQQEEQAIEKEYQETPAVNAKDDKGNYVATATVTSSKEFDSVKAIEFFNSCIQMSFDVPDTSNMEDVKIFQKENFSPNFIPVANKMYQEHKKIELVSYQIKAVREATINLKDGTKLSGYAVDYSCYYKEDGIEDSLYNKEEDKSFATAFIEPKDGKLTLITLTS